MLSERGDVSSMVGKGSVSVSVPLLDSRLGGAIVAVLSFHLGHRAKAGQCNSVCETMNDDDVKKAKATAGDAVEKAKERNGDCDMMK